MTSIYQGVFVYAIPRQEPMVFYRGRGGGLVMARPKAALLRMRLEIVFQPLGPVERTLFVNPALSNGTIGVLRVALICATSSKGIGKQALPMKRDQPSGRIEQVTGDPQFQDIGVFEQDQRHEAWVCRMRQRFAETRQWRIKTEESESHESRDPG